jgi:hypothetical protein
MHTVPETARRGNTTEREDPDFLRFGESVSLWLDTLPDQALEAVKRGMAEG